MDPYWYALTCVVIGGILGVVIPYLFKVMDSEVEFSYSYFYGLCVSMAIAAVASAQVNTIYDTYDMSVITLGAADDFTIWYKSNINIIS